MDSFSRSNQKRQEIILSQGIEKSSGSFGTSVCGYCRKDDNQPLTSSKNFYMIGRAYNEPQFCNHVENLLLQRNFIID